MTPEQKRQQAQQDAQTNKWEIGGVIYTDPVEAMAAMKARETALVTENARIKAQQDAAAAAPKSVTVKALKLGEFGEPFNGLPTPRKGNLAIYGLQRQPITLYAAQYPRLFAQCKAVATEILAHQDKLAWKGGEAEKAETLAWAAAAAK